LLSRTSARQAEDYAKKIIEESGSRPPWLVEPPIDAWFPSSRLEGSQQEVMLVSTGRWEKTLPQLAKSAKAAGFTQTKLWKGAKEVEHHFGYLNHPNASRFRLLGHKRRAFCAAFKPLKRASRFSCIAESFP
jgi:hypothetical protein